MSFDWDETKRRRNMAKHGYDFAVAPRLSWQIAVLDDVQNVDGEERDVVLVPFHANILHVVYTVRSDGGLRLISMRRATRSEELRYYDHSF